MSPLFGKTKPRADGYIGYYGLEQWWFSEFSPEEREYMETGFCFWPDPPGSRPLTQGRVSSTMLPASQLLYNLASWLKKPSDRHLRDRVRAKLQQVAVEHPQRSAGYHNGRHFSTYTLDVDDLLRAEDYVEAERLLLCLVRATEAEDATSQQGVAPWYYERLAVIYRKRKDYLAEVAILEQFARQRHAPGVMPPTLLERLGKAKVLAEKQLPKQEA